MPDKMLDPTLGYRELYKYSSAHRVSYSKFDADTQSELALFALREDMDLESLEAVLEKITSALPSLKRIFSSPIIRLRDSNEILPAEAVRIVNNKTLSHISVHSELWKDIGEGNLIPRKLMSIKYEDDYVIYENIIFARTVDAILRFVSQNLVILRDMLYANHELRFNLLERENHPLYFLALGKLHMGYLRDYDKYLLPIGRCFEKLYEFERVLKPRLSMTVYKKCHKKTVKLTLKRTNIFRSHKDYRKLYSLAKFISDVGIDAMDLSEDRQIEKEEYFTFCSMLCVFAAGHFNFKFDRADEIDFNSINADCKYCDWRLNISRAGDGILLTVKKEREYKILLCPLTEIPDLPADEKVFVTPSGFESMRLSLYDIDSFRRVQQMLLRAMIYADDEHKICPFCGKPLSEIESGFECGACRTVIKSEFCPETEKHYYLTELKYFKKRKDKSGEGLYYYRNITGITEDGIPICPICGKEH